MTTRNTILAAALTVLEQGGSAQFSTRTVCAIAGVTAPTLYHHFGSADGLLSAAMAKVFDDFLAGKRAAVRSSDPETALREGWDNYVGFASQRPRLYAAAMARLLGGAEIPAATEAQADLRQLVEAASHQGRLAMPVDDAVDLLWASANAAALLFVTRLSGQPSKAQPVTIAALREATMQQLLLS